MKNFFIFIFSFLILIFFYFSINEIKEHMTSEFKIDKIMYINLDHRTDRKKETESELDKFNLKYERFSAINHANGAIGCSKSHLAIIKHAKEKGYKNILVLEDDFEFIINKDQYYNEINKLSQAKFDVCLIAYSTPNLYDSPYPFLYKITDAQTTAGYIVQSHYYDTLIAEWEYAMELFEKTNDDTKYTCDQSWKTLQRRDNWYCFKTRIGKQRKSYSDIQKGIVDYNV